MLEEAEKECAQTGILGQEQKVLHDRACINPPIGDVPRSFALAESGTRLIGPAVAFDPRLWAHEHDDEHGRTQQPRPRKRFSAVIGQRRRPIRLHGATIAEHQKLDALAKPRRRSSSSQVQK